MNNIRMVVGIVGVAILASRLAMAGQGNERVILDTLGDLGTKVTFDFPGSAGQATSGETIVGPRFELTRWTVITLVGAYLNNCETILGGIPQCPAQFPLLVEIHRARPTGVPEHTSIATYQLTHDRDPLSVRFEFARPNLLLPPGKYFALFAPRWATDVGIIMDQGQIPQFFQAGFVRLGFLNPQTGAAAISSSKLRAAVRILGIRLGGRTDDQ